MHRLMLAVAILLFAASTHAVNPSRQGAGGDGNCPPTATDERAPATASDGSAPTTAPEAVPTPVRPKSTISRPKSGARWHSFLPGMFK
jgi:hypothetical protein